jgi:hypothetical protein
VATTVHRLQTERASGDRVGIKIATTVNVRIDGFAGKQFDGIVTGKYGHTFVPFSGASPGASSSVGDHNRFPYNDPFRIVVVAVHGTWHVSLRHRSLCERLHSV